MTDTQPGLFPVPPPRPAPVTGLTAPARRELLHAVRDAGLRRRAQLPTLADALVVDEVLNPRDARNGAVVGVPPARLVAYAEHPGPLAAQLLRTAATRADGDLVGDLLTWAPVPAEALAALPLPLAVAGCAGHHPASAALLATVGPRPTAWDALVSLWPAWSGTVAELLTAADGIADDRTWGVGRSQTALPAVARRRRTDEADPLRSFLRDVLVWRRREVPYRRTPAAVLLGAWAFAAPRGDHDLLACVLDAARRPPAVLRQAADTLTHPALRNAWAQRRR